MPPGLTAKDIVLAIIGKIGTAGGTGHVIEFAGPAIRALSMEGRMTVCNMTIEGGARAGLIAPDDTTFAYIKGRPKAPTGETWDQALAYWRTLQTEPGRTSIARCISMSRTCRRVVTWGTSPEDVALIDGSVPQILDTNDRAAARQNSALATIWG